MKALILALSLCIIGTLNVQAQSKKELVQRIETLEKNNEELKAQVAQYEIILKDMNMTLEVLKKHYNEEHANEHNHDHAHDHHDHDKPITNSGGGEMPLNMAKSTSIEFENTTFEFGKINEGEVAEHIFKFKNTGSEPLVISNARGSCGCTVPEWPKEAIAPGAIGEIKVKFNSKNKSGKQSKTVTLTANTTPDRTMLYVKGEVIKK